MNKLEQSNALRNFAKSMGEIADALEQEWIAEDPERLERHNARVKRATDLIEQLQAGDELEEARLKILRSQRKCAWCGYEFKTSDELADHIGEKHKTTN